MISDANVYLNSKYKPKDPIDQIAWILLQIYGCRFCKAIRQQPCNIKNGQLCTANIAAYIREEANKDFANKLTEITELIAEQNKLSDEAQKEAYRNGFEVGCSLAEKYFDAVEEQLDLMETFNAREKIDEWRKEVEAKKGNNLHQEIIPDESQKIHGFWIWDKNHSNYHCSICGEYDCTTPSICRKCNSDMEVK